MAGEFDFTEVDEKETYKDKKEQEIVKEMAKTTPRLLKFQEGDEVIVKHKKEKQAQMNLGGVDVSVKKAIDKQAKAKGYDGIKFYIFDLLKKDGIQVPDHLLRDMRKSE